MKLSAKDAIKLSITIDDHYDRLDFLRAWLKGDISEWNEEIKEFKDNKKKEEAAL